MNRKTYYATHVATHGGNSTTAQRRRHSSGPKFLDHASIDGQELQALIEFITPFIENANAAGVIGTEITIFEPLASAFGEECLRRFLSSSTIGESVRGARLKLLKDGNPLGLVYIPYVLSNLRLVERHTA